MLTCPFFLFAATSWTRLADEGGSAAPCRYGGARRAWLIRGALPGPGPAAPTGISANVL